MAIDRCGGCVALAERDTRRGCDDHRPDRPDAEHHERVAEEAVAEPLRPRQRVVLGDGQRRHVADAAPVEVAGGGVVDRMAVPPAVERREDDQPEGDAQPLVRALRRQERAVRAVVEEDVGAQQEAGGGDRDGEHEQVRDVEREVHQDREREVGHDRGRDVQQRAAEVRLWRTGRAAPARTGVPSAVRQSPACPVSRLIDARPGVRALDGGHGAHPLPCAAFRGAP